MILDLIRRHYLYFDFIQVVSDPAILNDTGYATYFNIRANMPGTTILARHDFPLTNDSSLPTVQIIDPVHNGLRLINITRTRRQGQKSGQGTFL